MYERILVPVDGSATSNLGLDEAIKLAKLTGAQIRLLHVVDEMPFVMSADSYGATSTDVLQILRENGSAILQNARSRVRDSGVAVDTALYESFSGRVCQKVADEATEWKADLVVIGTHGRHGIERVLLGSDAEQISRSAPVPVLLVRAAPTPQTPQTATA